MAARVPRMGEIHDVQPQVEIQYSLLALHGAIIVYFFYPRYSYPTRRSNSSTGGRNCAGSPASGSSPRSPSKMHCSRGEPRMEKHTMLAGAARFGEQVLPGQPPTHRGSPLSAVLFPQCRQDAIDDECNLAISDLSGQFPNVTLTIQNTPYKRNGRGPAFLKCF